MGCFFCLFAFFFVFPGTLRNRTHQNRVYFSEVPLVQGSYKLRIQEAYTVFHAEVAESHAETIELESFSFRQHAAGGIALCQSVSLRINIVTQRPTAERLIPIPHTLPRTPADHPVHSRAGRTYSSSSDEEDLYEGEAHARSVAGDSEGDRDGEGKGESIHDLPVTEDDSSRCRTLGVPLPMLVDDKSYGVHPADRGATPARGRLVVSGDHFVTIGRSVDQDGNMLGDAMSFHVREPSVLRVFTQTRAPGYEMDLILFSHAMDAISDNIMALSNDHGLTSELGASVRERSLRARLMPHDAPYVLRVKHAESSLAREDRLENADPEAMCGEFTMLFVLDPVARIEKALQCGGLTSSPPPASLATSGRQNLEQFGEYQFDTELIRQSLNDSSDDPNLLRYRIALTVGGDTVSERLSNRLHNQLVRFQAMVAYDFMVADLTLVLRNRTDESEIARSYSAPLLNHDADVMFGSTVDISLLPGEYFLDIEEEIEANPHFFEGDLVSLHPTKKQCIAFLFGVEAFTESSLDHPYICSIEPMGALHLDPLFDLEILIRFSVPVHLTAMTSHYHDLAASGAVWLHPVDSMAGTSVGRPLSVLPRTLRFTPHDATRLVAVFDHRHFSNDRTFRLEVDASKFNHKEDGSALGSFEPFRQNHVYHFGSAINFKHPQALSLSLSSELMQRPSAHRMSLGGGGVGLGLGLEWGEAVIHCPSGYHLAGRKCALDTACLPDTCSHHGFCSHQQGFPKCVCYPGFVSEGDKYCSTCEDPHQTFPDCSEPESRRDEYEMHARCSSTILPFHLNAPGFLSPQFHAQSQDQDQPQGQGSVHLCDWYHVNVDMGLHVMFFQLQVESVFRVYVLSDELVKVGLYPAVAGAPLLQSGTAYQLHEGGVFTVLPAASYHLVFVFDQDDYYGNPGRNLCPVMQVELAIEPLDRVMRLPQGKVHHPEHEVDGRESRQEGDEKARRQRLGVCRSMDQRPDLASELAQAASDSDAEGQQGREAQLPHPHDSETYKVVSTAETFHTVPFSGFRYQSAAFLTLNAQPVASVSDAPAMPAPSASPLRHSAPADAEAPMAAKGRLALELPFHIPEYLHHQAYIKAQVDYDFLVGQLRLELNHQLVGDQSQELWQQHEDFLAPSVLSWSATKYGDVSKNQNQLRLPLPPGNYTLLVHEPMAQNASLTHCAAFQLAVEIGFVPLPTHYQRMRTDKFRRYTPLESHVPSPPGGASTSSPSSSSPTSSGGGGGRSDSDDDADSDLERVSALTGLGLEAQSGGELEELEAVLPSVSPAAAATNASAAPRSRLSTRPAELAATVPEHVSRSVLVPLAEEFLDEECSLRPLPASLNVPGVLGPAGIHIHLYDHFRYDPAGHVHDVHFNVTAINHANFYEKQYDFTESLFRVYIPFHQTKLHVVMELLQLHTAAADGSATHTTSTVLKRADNAQQESLSAVLSAGPHLLRLHFDVHWSSFADEGEADTARTLSHLACLGFVMELALSPRPHLGDYRATHKYEDGESDGLTTHLPSFPDCPLPPFIYHTPVVPTARNKPLGQDDVVLRQTRPFVFLQRFVSTQHDEEHAATVAEARAHPSSHPLPRFVPLHSYPPDHQVLVTEMPLEIRDHNTVLEAELDHDFLQGHMMLSLRRVGELGTVEPRPDAPQPQPQPQHLTVYAEESDFGRQTLHTQLQVGLYVLTVRLLADWRDLDLVTAHEHAPFVDVPYEFDFSLRLLPHRDEVFVCMQQQQYALLPRTLNSVRFMGTDTTKPELFLRKGATHFFHKFLLPSVHMHERAGDEEKKKKNVPAALVTEPMADASTAPHLYNDVLEGDALFFGRNFLADRMQIHITSLSLMRLSFNTDSGNSIRLRLLEYPCKAENVHPFHISPTANLQCKPQVLFDTTDYQFDLVRFLYNGLFELEVHELDSAVGSAAGGAAASCAHYSLEFALEPMAAFSALHGSVFCPGAHGFGVDHFPPPPPAVVTAPYYYDSNYRAESLYIQQRNGQSRSESFFFTVPSPFRFFSELAYDFLRGDLVMDLMLSESSSVNIHTGVEHLNRHVIASDYMPPGRYVLTLREPNDGDMGWFCTVFAFTLAIAPIVIQPGSQLGFGLNGRGVPIEEDPLLLLSPLQRVITPYPRLPRSLDSPAFLGIRDDCHFFGTFSMLHDTQMLTHHLAHEGHGADTHEHATEAHVEIVDRAQESSSHADGDLPPASLVHTAHSSKESRVSSMLLHVPELLNAVRFSVDKVSVLRAFASPHKGAAFHVDLSLVQHARHDAADAEADANADVEVTELHADGHSEKSAAAAAAGEQSRAHRSGWLLASLLPGEYSVLVHVNRSGLAAALRASRWMDWGAAYLVDFELAVAPLFAADDADAARRRLRAGERAESTGSAVGEGDVFGVDLQRSDSVYHFSSQRMRLCNEPAKRRMHVHAIPFTVHHTSIAFVEVCMLYSCVYVRVGV